MYNKALTSNLGVIPRYCHCWHCCLPACLAAGGCGGTGTSCHPPPGSPTCERLTASLLFPPFGHYVTSLDPCCQGEWVEREGLITYSMLPQVFSAVLMLVLNLHVEKYCQDNPRLSRWFLFFVAFVTVYMLLGQDFKVN